MKKIQKSQFSFRPSGYGHYRVEYHTAVRGDYYVAVCDDMSLIDATKNEDYPTIAALKELAQYCRYHGTHYHSDGTRFED